MIEFDAAALSIFIDAMGISAKLYTLIPKSKLRFFLLLACCGLATPGVAGEQEKSAAPAIERLGERLFADPSLSEPRGVACASCHDPAHGFSGVNGSSIPGVARGAPAGSFGVRKPPALGYAAFTPAFGFVDKKDPVTHKMEKTPAGGQFRDGRTSSLEEQAAGPMLNPVEMNNPSKAAVVEKVKSGPNADLMREVFGAKVFDDPNAAFDALTKAIASYERSSVFSPFSSRFDDMLRGQARFSKQEAKGFALFVDPKKGNCIACHDGKIGSKRPKDWLFTDFTYDALGAPRNAAIPANADPQIYDLGLCRRPAIAQIAPKGFDVESLCGAFKAPSLRNVALTAPYLHNGSLKTLRDAVAFYATRDTNPERWYPKAADGSVAKFDDLPKKYWDNVNTKEVPYDRKQGEKPRLTDEEIDAIVAFLQTLTDRR